MNSLNSQRRALEELTANLESCQIDTNAIYATNHFFHQGSVSNPIGPCQDFRAIIDEVTPGVLPVDLTSPANLSPSSNFTEHHQ
ncbi:hypothetical protein CY34DRAFT_125840 [Suillus luteus UH-Slu-Lm8-n1]|uniref:Uncharacterized protein n=1 Tax=Suillus luteus UH-Slu-Lm8-n1 TaxID=930992 RepID=A0A0D0BQT4_9AGAM|nr:hypothetical protein CY34DRAFT_125840 [Suillus luteus UH-Slu-Lm8-n1]